MTALLPMHLALTGRPVLVVGGGPVGWRKARSCLDAGAEVIVVAPFACEDVADAADRGDLRWEQREFRTTDVIDTWLVFATAGDAEVDAAVERAANARHTFCVRADSARSGHGSRSPAVVHRDGLTVSVAGDVGADPVRARRVRDRIAELLDSGEVPLRRRRPGPGEVILVGGGPGDPDLMTVRARRVLARADVVIVDRLAPRSALKTLDPDVMIIDAGKAPGRHALAQHVINGLLVEHAAAGRVVVRLKGGDPFVFGRGAEEVAACRAAGVAVSVVPGVSSAVAVPLSAGIAVTERGVARQFTVLAGHDSDGPVCADWSALARGTGTLVVMMGVSVLPVIVDELLAAGMDPMTPVAIIEDGTLPTQRVTSAALDAIVELADRRAVRPPAVIVIGAVARSAKTSLVDVVRTQIGNDRH